MKGFFTITATLFLAMLLSIMTLPQSWLWVRPEWTLLVLIFWFLHAPQRCGVLLAAAVGLFQDSLTASLLGKHMLAYAVVAAITLLAYKRLRMFDVWQQAAFVFLLTGIDQLIEHWIALAAGRHSTGLWFLLPAMMSALLWPWLAIFLRQMCHRLGLYNRLGSR